MSEMLAIEWSGQEIRVALATGHGHRVVIEHAFSAPWNVADVPSAAKRDAADGASAAKPAPSASDANHPQQRIGRRIAEELDRRGIGRPPALVAVDRSSIELRQLQLPPAPDEDLPDMVRFQAAREFNELNEEWLLDFVPIDEAADGPRTVLAMAIAPAVIRQIEEVCEAAGLKMQRLLLRPCATASLLPPQGPETQRELRLLVELLADEADLTVVLDGKGVFLRTMRLAGATPSLPALEAEIRLTVAAAHNQFSGRKVRSIVICGQDAGHAELARSVQTEAGIPAELFDPFAGLELGPALRGKLPEHPGRFAPLLGMLVTELKNAGQTIDFLHPRRRAPAPSRRKKVVAAATTAAVLLLAWLAYGRLNNYWLATEADALTDQSKTLDLKLAALQKTRATVAAIDSWREGQSVWLDQLQALSEGFPPARDAILGQLTFAVRQGRSQVDLKGWVRDADVIAKMEERVRARAGRQIASKSSAEDHAMKGYSRRFDASLVEEKEAKP